MLIAKMLEYQKTDRELYILQKDFVAMQRDDKVLQVQNVYKEKSAALPRLNKEFGDIIALLNDLLKKTEALEGKQSALEADLGEFESIEDFNDYEKTLQALEDEINGVAREASRLGKRMNEINAETKKVQEQVETLQKQLVQYKNTLIRRQQEMIIKAKPINDKLQQIAKDIDPKMMEKYQACRNQWKFPVFVPYTEEGNCSACGMFVRPEVEKMLVKSGDYAECPHCRRILYKI